MSTVVTPASSDRANRTLKSSIVFQELDAQRYRNTPENLYCTTTAATFTEPSSRFGHKTPDELEEEVALEKAYMAELNRDLRSVHYTLGYDQQFQKPSTAGSLVSQDFRSPSVDLLLQSKRDLVSIGSSDRNSKSSLAFYHEKSVRDWAENCTRSTSRESFKHPRTMKTPTSPMRRAKQGQPLGANLFNTLEDADDQNNAREQRQRILKEMRTQHFGLQQPSSAPSTKETFSSTTQVEYYQKPLPDKAKDKEENEKVIKVIRESSLSLGQRADDSNTRQELMNTTYSSEICADAKRVLGMNQDQIRQDQKRRLEEKKKLVDIKRQLLSTSVVFGLDAQGGLPQERRKTTLVHKRKL